MGGGRVISLDDSHIGGLLGRLWGAVGTPVTIHFAD